MMERTATDPVFIVGLYKNGTSWLLSALAAHHEFSALRELDLIRTISRRRWGLQLRPSRERLARIFGRTEFCALRSEQLRPGAFHQYLDAKEFASTRSVYNLPAELAVSVIANATVHGRTSNRALPATNPVDTRRPLAYSDFPASVLVEAYTAVRDGVTIREVMDGFIEPLRRALPERNRLVLKGADQIASFEDLQTYWPRAPKIAIVRDGRDAAVSAYHFRQLMRNERLAWHNSYWSYWPFLEQLRNAALSLTTRISHGFGYGDDWRFGRSMWVWRDRVRQVLHWAQLGELYILRYEDLLDDFPRTLFALLTWLGADATPATLDAIGKASSFEAMTGRPRGVSAVHHIRRGMAGEGESALNSKEKRLALRIAGPELTALGYGPDGARTDMALRLD